eukprot:6879713-Alexandrium_andersonii.AAC.1
MPSKPSAKSRRSRDRPLSKDRVGTSAAARTAPTKPPIGVPANIKGGTRGHTRLKGGGAVCRSTPYTTNTKST